IRIGRCDLFADIFQQRVALRVVGLFPGEIEIGLDIAGFGFEELLCIDAVFDLLALLQNTLRLFLILPKIWIAYFFFECSELLAGGVSVKESSARAQYVS